MESQELRDPETAKRFLAEGLWLMRAVRPTGPVVLQTLEWAMEVASSGHPLPPLAFIADVGHIVRGTDTEYRPRDLLSIPGCPPNLIRAYEDHVLGRLYADWLFERAGDAIRSLTQPRDRVKAVAYVVNQIRERNRIPGVIVPPPVIRGLLSINPDQILSQGWEALMRDGPSRLQVRLVESLVTAARRSCGFLAKEDVEALEDRSAIGDMGQYVALRLIRQTTARMESLLPAQPVKPLVGRKEVPTRVHTDDLYPVGGYSSIATRGSLESLLHSQLAYMEHDRPDLFDVKFVRDELFYYSRDENQFLRRRRAFVFAFFPDLVAARFKDPELPHQRIVLLQSAVLALIHRLSDWLSRDAIRFELLFVDDANKDALREEMTLMELLLRAEIKRGDAGIRRVRDAAAVLAVLNDRARQAQVHCLAAATKPIVLETDRAVVTQFVISQARPALRSGDGPPTVFEADDAWDAWLQSVLHTLQLWV